LAAQLSRSYDAAYMMQIRMQDQSIQPDSSVSPPSVQYEFREAENVVISDCGGRARIWGILCILAGAVQLVASLLNIVRLIPGNGAIFSLPAGAFNILLGVYFMRAGGALQSVVDTRGNDITLMMDALRSFSRAFLVQIIATAVFILLVLGIVALMLATVAKV
jgi:hypothetical protein